MVKVGDLFEITLSNERCAIGHFVYRDKNNGPFIQVFNYIADKKDFNLEKAIQAKYIFPPVITGLGAAIRTGLWQIVGKKPVNDFVYPKFISTFWNDKTGEVTNWFLYDGSSYEKLGPILPVEYKNLEYLVVWSPYDINYRIETGEIPFPYGDLIKNNRFTPLTR
jgi:hypothetical protein